MLFRPMKGSLSLGNDSEKVSWLLSLVLVGCGWLSTRADDWPQWLGPQRDGIWREQGLLKEFPKDGPKVLWRMPISEGYGGPAVVGDRIYVMDRVRPVDDEGKPARATRAGIPGKERIL